LGVDRKLIIASQIRQQSKQARAFKTWKRFSANRIRRRGHPFSNLNHVGSLKSTRNPLFITRNYGDDCAGTIYSFPLVDRQKNKRTKGTKKNFQSLISQISYLSDRKTNTETTKSN
jgi:hypothetical protein